MQGVLSLLAMTCIVGLVSTAPAMAAAPGADVARKCRQLAIQAHPTQPAGTTQGSAQAQRGYFQDCVAKEQRQKAR
jgi:hypothetical protein